VNGSRRVMLVLAALVLLAGWYFRERLQMERHLGAFAELLFQVRGEEMALDREMERVVAFRISNYDELVKLRSKLQQALQALKNLGGRLQENAALFQALMNYGSALERKRRLLDEAVSHAAIVRNSLLYLPVLIRAVGKSSPESVPSLQAMLDELLTIQLFPERAGENGETLKAKIDAMRDQAGKVAGQTLRHLQNGLAQSNLLHSLAEQYRSVDSGDRFQVLRRLFLDHRQRQGRNSIFLGFGLLALVAVLLTWLWRALIRLQRMRDLAERARQRLADAVESIPEGVALFDNRDRLVLFNRTFAQMYPWLEKKLKPGAAFTELESEIRSHVHRTDLQGKSLPSLDRKALRQVSCIERLREGAWYLASNCHTSEGGTVWVRTDITRLREAEGELRKLGRALEQSPVSVVITDVNGIIEYVNPKFEEVSGYAAEELIGRRPSLLKSGEMPDEAYAKMWRTILSGGVWEGTFHNRRKDGSLYWESARIAPVRNENGEITHFIGVKEDITELRRYQESLRMSATVFNATTEGIVLTDAEGRVRMVNPAFTQITGYAPEEALGKSAVDFYGDDNPEISAKIVEELARHGSWAGEVASRRKDGSWYHQWLSVTTLHDEGGVSNGQVIIISDITQHKTDQARILYQANYDLLTGLPNRALLADRLRHALHAARRNRTLTAVAFLDLDRFKTVNDLYGHGTGDRLLEQVADRLQAVVRESDTVARFGGDEFVIVLEELSTGDQAAVVAAKMIRAIARPFDLGSRELVVGASVGLTLYPNDVPLEMEVEEAATLLLSNADMAMYQAKARGRNQFQFFEPRTQAEIRLSLALEQDLRRALENDELVLYYQPIVEMPENRIVSVEALLRWNHPRRGMVPPDQFIPLAEETGLIYEIGNWVIVTACKEVRRWHEKGLRVGLSVNVSARQRERGFSVKKLRALLEESGFDPAYLTLEITENLMMLESEEVIACLRGMKELGVGLSVDDFGTGYSSLSYLKQFPLDILKIDRAFVRDLPDDEEDVSLVRAIMAMADSLGIRVVAEGVEAEAQREFLMTLGCELMQGYRFDPPLPAEEVLRKYGPSFPNLEKGASPAPVAE